MTIAPERESASPSLKDSSVSDWDFSALGEAEPVAGIEEPSSTDATPETNTCPTCDRVIVRAPGQRGKLPKYHPECKPAAGRRSSATEKVGTRVGNPKAIREADEVIAMVKPQLFKAALMLSAIDQYDAFVVLNSIPSFCTSLHGILVRYEKLRKDALAMKAGGSIVGLIITVLTMILPILAHHGLIPGKAIQQALINFPVMMFKLAQRMKEGEQALADMMERVSEEMLRPKNGKQTNGNDAAPSA